MDEKTKSKKNVAEPSDGLSMTQAVFGLCKSAIGFGAFMLPKHFAYIGWVMGLLIMILASATATASAHFLSRLTSRTQSSSYFAIGRLALGKPGEIMAMISLILFQFGGLIAYIAQAGDCFRSGINLFYGSELISDHYNKWFIIAIAALVYPVACVRDMRVLGKTSMVGMGCMIYVLVLYLVACIYAFFNPDLSRNVTYIAFNSFKLKNYVNALSSLIFAFVNHFTVISTVPVLRDSSSTQRFRLTFLSAIGILGFYTVFSLCGYALFGQLLSDGKNVIHVMSLTLHPRLIKFQAFGQILVSLMLILSFPLLCDPIRASVEELIKRIMQRKNSKGNGSMKIGFLSPLNLIISAILVSMPTIIAIFCFELADKLLSMFSALAGSMLVYLMPSVFLWRLRRPSNIHVSKVEMIFSVINIILGLPLMILGTYFGVCALIEYFSPVASQ